MPKYVKMKCILPAVLWLWQLISLVNAQGGIGFGIKREIFFLNLEDGYFGCQVNESTTVLQLYELSRLCDGKQDCYKGSDELRRELKCTNDCEAKEGTPCQNGACLDSLCHCNDGYGGCSCQVPDENECKYRPCDVFAHCTNTLGSFTCSCFPGYVGDGFHCQDINECEDPAIVSRCVQNAECCNLPSHFLCKCKPGYVGDGEVECKDIDECLRPDACGNNAICRNTPGNYTCDCQQGFVGNPYDGCVDVNECSLPNACGPGSLCTNFPGGHHCECPEGYAGDAYGTGCHDVDECSRSPCGKDAQCHNNEGSFRCTCPPGFVGDPFHSCKVVGCSAHYECPSGQACIANQCQNPCQHNNPCNSQQDCQVQDHQPVCLKLCQCQKNEHCQNGYVCDGCNCILSSQDPIAIPGCEHCPTGVPCDPITGACAKVTCNTNNDCTNGEVCIQQICQNQCTVHNPCAQNAACINTAHGVDCSCVEGFQGNGFVGCLPVRSYKPICQYNEDCPPDKLCDRLNRVCINPCAEDSCGENAECYPVNHGTECRCLQGHQGNPYISCASVTGCRSNKECSTNEACINGKCSNPCRCGPNAVCDVVNHKATCKCLAGYNGNPLVGCQAPQNPCDPNPCGMHALCEIDNGNPICYCPKGMTGNPFKSCIPEGDECSPNPCGPYSGCRVVQGSAVCFCLSEYEGDPPITPCRLPTNPCTPSPCGPNTQCTLLDNGFSKCTCLPGYIESPNTIRGCVEKKNPCEPNPCGQSAVCDPNRQPSCFCPDPLIGNPYKFCGEPLKTLCQPGPCGVNADCYVTGSNEQCYCKNGYSGNPYNGCTLIPTSPCEPNPCGKYAYCKISSEGKPLCSCPDGMGGNPLTGCKGPECSTNDECPWDKSCLGYKCNDPCPGACGVGASCKVENHRPVCTCNRGLTGNPLFRCYQISSDPAPTGNPCLPNPCGINTECKIQNRKPVCSCLPNFVGDPKTGCQPECVLNTDCKNHQACIDYRCRDPCAFGNICGLGAVCQCKDHTPLCSCREGFVGDPFLQCLPKPDDEPFKNMTLPCAPSPCDPYASCNVYGGQIAMCDPCSSTEQQWNPQCHPQCLYNSDCPFNLACVGQKCIDPCPGSCGIQAECTVVYHNPICSCQSGLIGNPYEHCTTPKQNDVAKPLTCDQVQCGANAVCKKSNGMTVCVCRQQYYGNPYLSCRPECVINTDCGQTLACINNKCVNPCLGVCGVNAQCQVVNHFPVCFCQQDYSGDPFVSCYQAARPNYPPIMGPADNACDPSPCGSNSRCHISEQGFATCSCLPGYRGSPPVCKPECVVSAECPQTQACLNQKCVDPCPGTCGVGANCYSICHNPICSCPPGHVGDPFVSCHLPLGEETPKIPGNPCEPTPCGPNSICEIKKGHPVCSCSPNYIGSPPYCRPECIMNHECPHNKACIQEKCQNPCTKSCGLNAKCDVVNHTPFCTCESGYEGDAFISCTRIPPTVLPEIPRDPCNPSPCGENTQCFSENNGVSKCVCIPPYIGNPYSGGCRPECLMNSDCMSNLACLASHCRDPCPGVCGLNAQCNVVSHVPVCTCFPGYVGDPFQSCRREPISPPIPQNPCEPSPCGPNSQCRTQGYNAVCSCIQGFIGTPPSCRPECVVSAECPVDKACIAQKCSDPCPGTCGLHARCNVINHNPICTCPPKFVGDPFVRCIQEEPKTPPVVYQDPCFPSPCGANSECREHDSRPVCSCLPGMLGAPPNCRPECLIHADCPTRLACLQSKCRDPCTGSCGFNSRCTVINHQPVCSCEPGYQGDPFNGCNAVAAIDYTPVTPCNPSPCGANAVCKESNGAGSCSCIPEYFGDPYSGCRPECVNNLDCAWNKACINYKCIDPCIGACGLYAECKVSNHAPTCYCLPGYTGSALLSCHKIEFDPTCEVDLIITKNPCMKSPCGQYSQCRAVNGHAVCSCLPGYFGNPPNCHPECITSSDCPQDKSCVNQICSDPCPGTCGYNAQCRVVNHSPICSCYSGYYGDPFVRCAIIEKPLPPEQDRLPQNPCVPSPCGPNSICLPKDSIPTCSCLPNYIGRPPCCRPECTINAECFGNLACVNERCIDPCPGSCGINAFCKVISHNPVCKCNDGYTGDPFIACRPTPISLPPPADVPSDPCNPSPCGANAICKERNNAGSCTCIPEYTGDPYTGCRPECVLNSECPRDRACINNKCRDPCPGMCGLYAECRVINHSPSCACLPGYTGNPLSACQLLPVASPDLPPKNPCIPSPCGPYSQCRTINDHAVCSCQTNYIGTPPACHPECMVSSECAQDKACVNQKCVDPCPGTCGLNARCQVVNHNPICSCSAGYTGDPFVRCLQEKPTYYDEPSIPTNPCVPSPCGPNSLCRDHSGTPACSCLSNYIGRPPNCRPECTINAECPGNLACVNEKCRDPCPGSCGIYATCNTVKHVPQCVCQNGYTGDPFSGCSLIQQTPTEGPKMPCNPSPCGANAICKERNGAGSCSCLPEYFGDPYTGCRPECVTNSDCDRSKSCMNNKCRDPCPGVCGLNAECRVINHSPSCYCPVGYTGDPTLSCYIQPLLDPEPPTNPCIPSPCGPYSQCRPVNNHAVCSCQTDYIGTPPACRPECMVSSECPQDKACVRKKCIDPCPGTCGSNGRCQVVNHSPICSCPPGYNGDPFVRCFKEQPPPADIPSNPCVPSPCGPNSVCREIGNTPACSCLDSYIGRPPNCRPECTINAECPGNLACSKERCKDPCPGSCGIYASCVTINHSPQCNCEPGYTGDPFAGCSLIQQVVPTEGPKMPCNPSPCGANAICKERNGAGSCICLPEYFGDPYTGCRPECVTNSECDRSKACVNNKCRDPCPGTCGLNAECSVINHAPSCTCFPGYTGNPITACHMPPPMDEIPKNPCEPSPCGPYSICRTVNGHAVCSCQTNYVGTPPGCRPECVVSSECPQNRACINQKCSDPCIGICGIGARCQVINHNPICSCPNGLIGDPFVQCKSEPRPTQPPPSGNPCVPSPCGLNSICREVGSTPACSCLPNYIGRPPNCRPECSINAECPGNLACLNERCKDPCPGSCGVHATCVTRNHRPQCTCETGYTGDPFAGCSIVQQIPPTEGPRDPCNPSPCGANAICREKNGAGSCVCLPEYFGDPYTGCRPECVTNADCDRTKACANNKCKDPCPGTCGLNAECKVLNHAPSCSCIPGYTGDPLSICNVIPITEATPIDPCVPSPCGPNSQCRELNDHAVCSCLSSYIGTPPSCRPECVVSSECSQNKACVNQKCSDPCIGTCGLNTRCQVVNHNPICSCSPGYTGDPFASCNKIQPTTTPSPPTAPCSPSPCGPHSQCRVVSNTAACSCLQNYIGRPPNCRPECVISAECSSNLACINEKCSDPCPGSCGQYAHCRVINHHPVCTCLPGYTGDALTYCQLLPTSTERSPEAVDPCYPSPCGPNSDCVNRNGVAACTCSTGFFGDPYTGCRRECENNDDCNLALACIGYKCIDPCPGTCGSEALCTVVKHIPICSCPPSFTGDPFTSCRPIPVIPTQREPIDPCHPSPCGPNSQCRKINDQAVCSCLPNYMGSPPECRPECVVSSECPLDKACTNQKCLDPCPNTCGIQALCTVRNHNPICACPAGYSGDPFSLCALIPTTPTPPVTERPASCYPTPCGPNSQCQIQNGIPVCSCLPDFIGSPPSCRPECVISAECPSQLACMNQKCRDPCVGSCGLNANCHVLNHVPICTCNNGLTGDPFALCTQIQITTERPLASDPCNPSPCGPNAICKGNGNCECLPEYTGNPYENCRPECVLNTECSRDKACMRNKCRDPCIGTCGQGANCDVVNHIPICSCPTKYSGDPFTICRPVPEDVPVSSDPCNPSPCGPYSQCRNTNNHAVCSCLPNYIGAPPSCRPECTVSSECNPDKACVNMKCINPCIGACGSGARCEVINHSPICSCREGQTGDPFRSCYLIPKPVLPPQNDPPKLPCVPSPCGPNSQCIASGNNPSCSCLPSYIGAPPNCRPECIINPDCPSTLACINNKCRDPCPGSCGSDAHCQVVNHAVSCLCPTGYTGNPFVQCIYQQENLNPCEPSPCGANAICKQQDGAGSCSCINDYYGNPYEGCRPECVHSSDCPTNKACIGNKCVDPCPGVCGVDAVCTVISHVPTCNCIPGYIGNPFTYCQLQPPTTQATVYDPCNPSPCGPNSQCKNVNQQGVCSCQKEYQGTPPNCRPECVVNNECPSNRACHKFKCTDPCPGTCGLNARCEVINHSPICTCSPGLIGDPFTRCYPQPVKPLDEPVIPTNPCIPSPCGPNSECRPVGNQPSCSCRTNYVGSPPNCRPECSVNSDCPSMLSCISDKCRDPCYGSCGLNTDCRVQNHIPTCTCIAGHNGDPFTQCVPIIVQPTLATPTDPCNPSPCGSNTQCYNGVCQCLANYFGDPSIGCRPECTMNTDCPRNKACLNQKCQDPCPGTCGQGAICDVINHIPTCSCPTGTVGDAFVICRPIKVQDEPSRDPCNPSPCGPNSVCRVVEGHAVCSCQNSMIGSPPSCRPECVVSAECPLTQACLMSKCRDPCPGTCGHLANCKVVNHSPICTCPPRHSGDPFRSCYPVQEVRPTPSADPINVCVPSPCGPNSECRDRGGAPACSCLPNYVGTPPSCRPECTINPECPSHLSCINQKCTDPCPGSCGSNAACTVINHTPMCSCNNGFTGDPFTYCQSVPAVQPTPTSPSDPCYPSPCGPNARCRVENQNAICECLPEYQGNPYESCRPECLVSSDCTMNKACIRNKCQDPCPGTCGISAICFVSNHIPICSCPESLTGDPFQMCHPIPVRDPVPSDPCVPSPCGPNTRCRVMNGAAICECLQGYEGSPTTSGCRPECVISPDCPRNRACVNNKCVDPCIGVCGYEAICQTINHSPVCSCPPPTIGDPFVECKQQPALPSDPCNPSPCGSNGQCRVIGKVASCVYPECIINQDCPRDKACFTQKCQDPCRDVCGLNAICQVVNHNALCSCPPGYYGEPKQQCIIQRSPEPKPECTTDSECSNDKACINYVCKNPCQESPTTCARNALCYVQQHRSVCVCKDGMTGNAQIQCVEIGCRADTDCPPEKSCVNGDCIDPCTYTHCGINALCRTDGYHRARCYCPPAYEGDPFVECRRPECVVDSDCPSTLACRNQHCQSPCDCAPTALCNVVNYVASCRCPPGYIGNPHTSCTLTPLAIPPQCTMDSDCASKLACFNGQCKNPCYEIKPCGPNAECIVVDTLPHRTMSCQCIPGYVGDADIQCKLGAPSSVGCTSNDECQPTDTCLNRQCVNPCTVSNPCSSTALCTINNHKAVCKCPDGLSGDPFISCYKVPLATPECTTDSECPSSKICANQFCQDPCQISKPCDPTAECVTINHRPICNCPNGWAGNPQIQCYKPGCKTDSDCVYDKACINSNCLNPCSTQSCGHGADCIVQAHKAHCICPAGTQGSPMVSCVSVVCQYNEDCADHEACDRLNRRCRPVCEQDTCAEQATCLAQAHQPTCTCLNGFQGNPYIECIESRVPSITPECTTDSDCPSQHACVNQRCQNPCTISVLCSPDQECHVQDTVPYRTVMCQCRSDTVATIDGRCKPIVPITPQCKSDQECQLSERCVNQGCIEACRIDPCGINAQCISQNHQAACSCPPGYTGNPHTECSLQQSIPILPPSPECTKNDDCASDKTCVNQRCISPCTLGDSCGRGSFCHTQNHQPVCRCPNGYIGDPRIACTPPSSVPTVGCVSSTDCSSEESCINRLCVNPCNCGPNSDCKVNNHYPSCICKPGYYGNPQQGCIKMGCTSDDQCAYDKQCYNGECVPPCLLSDPCAPTAKCYGDNHRAACQCPPGYFGNPFEKCERTECTYDVDCPSDRMCFDQHCINPCTEHGTPCASNAICSVRNHAATCRCPENLPMGDPNTYCERLPPPLFGEPECKIDVDCASRLACIKEKCVNPCQEIKPCSNSAMCTVLDSVPVRTMTCTCSEGWVLDEGGECRPVIVSSPPGCTSNDDCPSNEACLNRQCRNPCNCGTNAQCFVQNHHPVCSCLEGYDGNPNFACRIVGCKRNSECESGKACINGHCLNPCIVEDPCGPNAECFTVASRPECRCKSGYRGNPYDRCLVIGCHSNNDCPNDRSCINGQCINPCVYEHPCSSQAECKVQNHFALCRCPPGMVGNPYVACRQEAQPECKEDADCPSLLACFDNVCRNPCTTLEPCKRPAECVVIDSLPVRTMICECPSGYVSSGSGTCKITPPMTAVACTADTQCPSDRACLNGRCIDPCNCGPNSECRVWDHKPVCSCLAGFDGSPEIDCSRAGCRSESDCSGQHTCVNRICVAVCAADGSSCGTASECYGINHQAVCECPPGMAGNPQIACVVAGCRSDSDCPSDKACINTKCIDPCTRNNPCVKPAECTVYNHRTDCACPPGYIGNAGTTCKQIEAGCQSDSDCPSQTGCINKLCVSPCDASSPCGINSKCKVLDTFPIRTMTCECLPGTQGNAAIRCDEVSKCPIDKGYVRNDDGECVCPPGTALNQEDECRRCVVELGYKIDERGHCVCALDRGLIIDERGRCICPTEHGYSLNIYGQCVPKNTTQLRTDFPRPDMVVTCLSDGVQVEIHITEKGFNGVLYVKGHSKNEQCRRVVSMAPDSPPRTEIFKVNFGNCGLIHINGQASFVLVIQKHPKLVTYKAQAYHIRCVYNTGEQNVTLGFNVSMLTTAGTIANTGPPPTCLMKIVTHTGQEIDSAEIGDNLMLQVDVQPSSIYGGYARSCVAKTIEDNVENEYIVTDENGCATDPTIFGEWDYNADTQSLLAGFNAFKFPSSDNIRFQCNIRVCFGKCQPVNCRGYNAFGRRRRREISKNNNEPDDDALESIQRGQLREEITIESNAILTFERREERLMDPTEAPIIQPAEDICVSVIGLIVALVITALLALVAVAVAVSCWLMAYRRTPNVNGPLPHPTQVPNPMFMNHDRTSSEPSPDYLT